MSELILIDHTEPKWSARYSRGGRENGAATYSRDIVRHHIPAIKRIVDTAGIKAVISTAPHFDQVTKDHLPEKADLALQYLHTYDYNKPLRRPKEILRASREFSAQTIFITSYRPFYVELIANGFKAIYLPMAIDTQKVIQTVKGVKKFHWKRPHIIYFGNITSVKQRTWRELSREFKRHGWVLDRIDSGKFNGGKRFTQEESWKHIAQYEYGIGVGRCALEMMAMGVKVMIAGQEFAGLITNDNDLEAQREVNMNGRIVTFNRDIPTCIRLIDRSMPVLSDVIDADFTVKLLEKNLNAYVTITTDKIRG